MQPSVPTVPATVAALEQLWEAACEATLEADMGYEHARALFGLARSPAHPAGRQEPRCRRPRRPHGASPVDLGATPLKPGTSTPWHRTIPRRACPDRADGAILASAPTHLPGNPPLTPREREVLDGLLSGETYTQIATRLFISDKTVSTHVSHVLRKTGTTNRIELAALASRNASTAEQDRHPPGHRS